MLGISRLNDLHDDENLTLFLRPWRLLDAAFDMRFFTTVIGYFRTITYIAIRGR